MNHYLNINIDILSCIEFYLSSSSFLILAWTCRMFRQRYFHKLNKYEAKEIIKDVILFGDPILYEYVIKILGFGDKIYLYSSIKWATSFGLLNMLKYLYLNHNIILNENLCKYAASNGQLETLKWLKENNVPWHIILVMKQQKGDT